MLEREALSSWVGDLVGKDGRAAPTVSGASAP